MSRPAGDGKTTRGVAPSTLGQDTGLPRGDISAPGVKEIRKVLLLRRSGQRLGLYLRGGLDVRTGVYVSGLDKGGQAEKQGLRVGDKVLRVNETDFRQITHADAVKVIKHAPRMVVYVTSAHAHRMPVNHKPVKLTPEEEEKERVITISADQDGYLGCSIRGGSDYGMEVCVSHVDRDSPSHRAGLRRGDVILKINEADVAGMTHMDAVTLATGAAELRFLVLQKPGSCTLKRSTQNDIDKDRHNEDEIRARTLPQDRTHGTNHGSHTLLLSKTPPSTLHRDHHHHHNHHHHHRSLGGNKVTKLISKTLRLNMAQLSEKEGKFYTKGANPVTRMLRQRRQSPNDIFSMAAGSQHRSAAWGRTRGQSAKSASTSDLNLLNDLMGGNSANGNTLGSKSTPTSPVAEFKILNIRPDEPEYEEYVSNTPL